MNRCNVGKRLLNNCKFVYNVYTIHNSIHKCWSSVNISQQFSYAVLLNILLFHWSDTQSDRSFRLIHIRYDFFFIIDFVIIVIEYSYFVIKSLIKPCDVKTNGFTFCVQYLMDFWEVLGAYNLRSALGHESNMDIRSGFCDWLESFIRSIIFPHCNLEYILPPPP